MPVPNPKNMAEAVALLERATEIGLRKRADFDLGGIHPALVGAGVGAGLGGLYQLSKPKNERSILKGLAFGGGLGAAGGFGYKALSDWADKAQQSTPPAGIAPDGTKHWSRPAGVDDKTWLDMQQRADYKADMAASADKIRNSDNLLDRVMASYGGATSAVLRAPRTIETLRGGNREEIDNIRRTSDYLGPTPFIINRIGDMLDGGTGQGGQK